MSFSALSPQHRVPVIIFIHLSRLVIKDLLQVQGLDFKAKTSVGAVIFEVGGG